MGQHSMGGSTSTVWEMSGWKWAGMQRFSRISTSDRVVWAPEAILSCLLLQVTAGEHCAAICCYVPVHNTTHIHTHTLSGVDR